ncbi:hypothetical protein AYX14_00623 [Cryptococcus neoformans]|nr:hypothetical protein AYX14_00623 [Cryptococcus neoformans var. grubii]OXG11013.1 DNA repair protein RAD50 [Cryptococcus neoformans var. grubii Tu401-1]
MASLNKLAIRGIRSFDDKHVQVIEFYSPLTVIVGHNGSGKTTIIECLKYATTGDMPPNTKGGAFVHDPKMAGEKEVKAQVRLRFWNAKRERMTATRNLQVTTKKTGQLTMKTLEGILAKTDVGDASGKRNTISTKCSEMDEEVPYLLGVSRAILENVIFCHQEESNWPLSEPAALKKKFDDIFEATKYTKALDNIKTLRKERMAELKVDKERLKFLKADKDKAERLRKDLEESISQENRKQTELDNLKERYETIKIRNAEFYEEATHFRQIYEQSKSLKEKKKMYEDNRKHSKLNMQEMDESTEELLHMQQNFDAHLRTLTMQRSEKENAKEKEESELEDLRAKERNLANRQGGLVAHRQTYERNLREREAAIRQIAKAHDLVGYDYSPLEDSKVAEFVDKIYDMVRKAESDLKKLQMENSRKERELQEELDRLSTMKASAQATKKSKEEQIVRLTEKIRTSEATFHSISNPSVELELNQDKLTELEADLSKFQVEIADAKYDEKINQKGLLIRQKELERDNISAELAVLNRKADSRAKLDLQRNELEGKNSQISTLLKTHEAKFRELVEADIHDVKPEDIEDKVISAISRKDRDLIQEENGASALNRDYSQVQASLSRAREELAIKKREIHNMQREIQAAIYNVNQPAEGEEVPAEEAKDLAEAFDICRSEIETVQRAIMDKQGSRVVWEGLLTTVKTGGVCEACNRGIKHEEKNAVTRHMEAKIRQLMEAEQAGVDAEIEVEKSWTEILDTLIRVEPHEAKIQDLQRRVIPRLETQIKEGEEKLRSLVKEVDDSKTSIQKLKSASRDLQNLKATASYINRLYIETGDLKANVKRLQTELESSGNSKTVEEVQKEVDRVSQEIKTLSREQQALTSEKELKVNALRATQDEIGRKSLHIGRLKAQLDKRKMEEEALSDMQNTLGALHDELQDLDQTVQAAEAPWKEKNETLGRFRTERANTEKEASTQVRTYQSSLGEIEGKHKACQAYVAEGNDRKIRENEIAMSEIKRQISQSSDLRAALEAEISSLSSELSKSESLKANIRSNLKYREDGKKIEMVQAELDELDLDSAAESRAKFNKEYKGMLDEETEAQGLMAITQGGLLEMRANRQKMEKSLKMDYKNIDKEHKEQLIKTTISEYANNDLEKYGKALDNAILKYHSIKMDEINDTIGHLWNKTYQGTDIDGIRIVSDHDEASTSTRKSYNYRVVMVKNEVELDMRGRCSAGQKVLASIIIRLALAESFGQGCGVLALDEPTTNLDQENINALAESLAEIIRERRQQANFQLIVITHDEGFLQRLAEQDVVEYYWRVSRDASQKSVLERQRVGRG